MGRCGRASTPGIGYTRALAQGGVTSKQTRQRQLAQLKARRDAARRRWARRRALLVYGSVGLGIVALVIVGAVVLNRKPSASKPAAASRTSTPPATTAAPRYDDARAGAPTAPAGVACGGKIPAKVDHPTFKAPPKPTISPHRRYDVTLATSCGSFTIRLDPASAPVAANNFLFLAGHHFYDSTWFHRIVPNFVIQGGDPKGTGAGGPGYTIRDEPPKGTDPYRKYVVAMARTSAPNSAGSQFFVLTADNPGLPHQYAVFGKVIAGQGVVDRLGRIPDVPGSDPQQGTPAQSAWIEHATVKVS